MVEGPFVGYGPKVDEAWDSIANDSKYSGTLILVESCAKSI